MPSTYTVFSDYNYYALCLYIAKISGSDIKSVVTKPQLIYLNTYLSSSELGVKSVVCEYEYVEKFYLSDYAEYFVRCFHDYRRKASRIHFFSCDLKESDFRDLLNGRVSNPDGETKRLQDHYLGFMVVRPIPETFIAITCLRPYSSLLTNKQNAVVLSRANKISLFGIPLTVDSLPFQEQDRVVAICATAALWSFFNAPIFQLQRIPSPSEITKQASRVPENANRTFPSAGLSSQMLVSSLIDKGLDPFTYGFKDTYLDTKQHISDRCKAQYNNNEMTEAQKNGLSVDAAFSLLKEYVYAYVSCGLPVILGTNAFEPIEKSDAKKHKCVGRHAVTVSGFNLQLFHSKRPVSNEEDSTNLICINELTGNLNLRAHRIKEIYVHDDQLGPYATATMVNKSFYIEPGRNDCGTDSSYEGNQLRYLDMSLWDKEAELHPPRLHIPSELIIGVIPKIRIGYTRIKKTCIDLNKYTSIGWHEYLKKLKEMGFNKSPLAHYGADYSNIEWDIRLLTVNQFKAELFQRLQHVVGGCERYLTTSWPKHVWVATGRYISGDTEKLLFDYIFDATDIDQGNVYLETIYYSKKYYEFSRSYLSFVFTSLTDGRVKNNEAYNKNSNLRQVAIKMTEDVQNLTDELTLRFGVPHPAAYIKDFEVVNDGIMQQTDVQVFKFGLIPQNKTKLDEKAPYIWAVCEQGYLHLGRDIPVNNMNQTKGTIGHPTLTAKLWARIAGELRFDSSKQCWIVNNNSGRFCKPYVGVKSNHLDNVKKLFAVYYPEISDQIITDFIEHSD